MIQERIHKTNVQSNFETENQDSMSEYFIRI